MSTDAFSLLHSGVQRALFTMGWNRLHPIQVQAIQKTIQGDGHLIISAQTAGGKTEAAFLPVISKIAAQPESSVQALYIGPLKALINDQFARLEKLCEHVEIPVHRWHGDVPASQKRALRESPSGILLITPESLESNFINYGVQIPRIYRRLQFVVIDELHSFLDNVRGIHLRSLLNRLSVASGQMPRLIGLSATLADPNSARGFLCSDNPDSVDLVSDPNSQREIKYIIKAYLRRQKSEGEELTEPRIKPSQALELVQTLGPKEVARNNPFDKENAPELAPVKARSDTVPGGDLDEIAQDICQHFTRSTNLVFVNAKRTIEELALKLHERATENLPWDPFVVHHGSLSKELREEAETKLKSKAPTTAICSSTLEMGIDIGSVRAIGQVDPPWSVSSLMQRLGRSGRREGEAAIMRMYVREDSPGWGSSLTDLLYPDLLRAIALTRLMLEKWLEPPDTDRLHLSTLIHQILSCLKQTGGLGAMILHDGLVKRGPFRNVTTQQFATLLRGLGNKKLIEQTPDGLLILGLQGEKIASSYDFYSAFKATEEFFVRHADQQIGMLPSDAIPPVGEHLILDGRRWKVEDIETNTTTVFVSPARRGNTPIFRSAGGEFHTRVLQEMRVVLIDNEEPAYLDKDAKLLLRAARVLARRCGLDRTQVITHPQSVKWFPWVGSRCLQTLSLFARAGGVAHEVDQLSITYKIPAPAFEAHLRWIADSKLTSSELAAMFPVLVDKFDSFIPECLLNESNGRNRLNISEAKFTVSQTLEAL